MNSYQIEIPLGVPNLIVTSLDLLRSTMDLLRDLIKDAEFLVFSPWIYFENWTGNRLMLVTDLMIYLSDFVQDSAGEDGLKHYKHLKSVTNITVLLLTYFSASKSICTPLQFWRRLRQITHLKNQKYLKSQNLFNNYYFTVIVSQSLKWLFPRIHLLLNHKKRKKIY